MSSRSRRSANHFAGQVRSGVDQRGHDLSRVGQEAQDVADRPEISRLLIIVDDPAVPPIGRRRRRRRWQCRAISRSWCTWCITSRSAGPHEVSAQSITPVIRSPCHKMLPGGSRGGPVRVGSPADRRRIARWPAATALVGTSSSAPEDRRVPRRRTDEAGDQYRRASRG